MWVFGLTNNKILFVHIPVHLYSLELYLKNLLCVNVLIYLFSFWNLNGSRKFYWRNRGKGYYGQKEILVSVIENLEILMIVSPNSRV